MYSSIYSYILIWLSDSSQYIIVIVNILSMFSILAMEGLVFSADAVSNQSGKTHFYFICIFNLYLKSSSTQKPTSI